jgi:RNA polymerase sigma factor (sigma-70 family)
MAADDSESSDARLWARACAGDRTAFGDLFVRHANRVHNYCFRRTGVWALAEDATSQTFMDTWRRRSTIDVGESLLPWLFTVANNVCRNADRGRRRHKNLLAKVPAPDVVADHADEVAARVDDERQMQRVLAALRTLKRADQDVVAMCDWEGLSYSEVAAALGVPIGTVRSRLSRARARLKDLLADEHDHTRPDIRVRSDDLRGEEA